MQGPKLQNPEKLHQLWVIAPGFASLVTVLFKFFFETVSESKTDTRSIG